MFIKYYRTFSNFQFMYHNIILDTSYKIKHTLTLVSLTNILYLLLANSIKYLCNYVTLDEFFVTEILMKLESTNQATVIPTGLNKTFSWNNYNFFVYILKGANAVMYVFVWKKHRLLNELMWRVALSFNNQWEHIYRLML